MGRVAASARADRADHSATVPDAKAGHARRRRGARIVGRPVARVEGTPVEWSDAGAAQPRVIDAPANPAAMTASIAPRRSAGTSQASARVVARAPRSTRSRVGRATAFAGAADIERRAAPHTTTTAAPTVASARASCWSRPADCTAANVAVAAIGATSTAAPSDGTGATRERPSAITVTTTSSASVRTTAATGSPSCPGGEGETGGNASSIRNAACAYGRSDSANRA